MEDVDLEGAAVTVRRQRMLIGWDVIEGDSKSEAGGRTVPLDAGTVAALRGPRRAQLAERLVLGSGVGGLGQGVHPGERGPAAPGHGQRPLP